MGLLNAIYEFIEPGYEQRLENERLAKIQKPIDDYHANRKAEEERKRPKTVEQAEDLCQKEVIAAEGRAFCKAANVSIDARHFRINDLREKKGEPPVDFELDGSVMHQEHVGISLENVEFREPAHIAFFIKLKAGSRQEAVEKARKHFVELDLPPPLEGDFLTFVDESNPKGDYRVSMGFEPQAVAEAYALTEKIKPLKRDAGNAVLEKYRKIKETLVPAESHVDRQDQRDVDGTPGLPGH